jgi:hypothetical protein
MHGYRGPVTGLSRSVPSRLEMQSEESEESEESENDEDYYDEDDDTEGSYSRPLVS